MSFLSATISMFLIMNSVGHIIGYLDLVQSLDTKRRRVIIVREMLFALLIMVFFYFVGEFLLSALEVGHQTVLLAGGLVLFLIAIRMIFPHAKPVLLKEKEEPFVFPIATPMIAGPSILTTIMIYARQEESGYMVLLAIFVAWAFSITILLFAEQIKNTVGKRALVAVERLMGLLLTMMAVEMVLNGIRSLVVDGIGIGK
jgi:multiple antibiotic resistance protein